MRFLLGLVLLASIGWGGFWFVSSSALEKAANGWFSQQQGQGWLAEGKATIAGFPNRFDLTFRDIDLADPDTGLAWQAAFFQVLALSYKPNHVIAIWPREQRIATPDETIDILSEDMRASLVLDAGPSLALNRTNFVVQALALQSSKDGPSTLDAVRFAMRRLVADGSPENTYDIGFQADGYTPTTPILKMLDPVASLPKSLSQIHLAANVTFDAPWDRFAVEDQRPQPIKIDLRDFTTLWGDLELRMAGTLDIDSAGIATGRIVVKATNWREMLALAVNAGSLPREIAPTVENMLGTLAGMSGPKNTLDVPLIFAKGRISFGPIPLGPAPRFVLR